MKFSDNGFATYKEEAKKKWGNTDSFRQYEEKTEKFSKDKWHSLADEMDGIMAEFAGCLKRGDAPSSETAQGLVKKLQGHITGSYYNCTDEILSGLGKMYVGDDRFKTNIDRHGKGTAEFISKAVGFYCDGMI